MPVETPWLKGTGIPYCVRGQLCAEDVAAVLWMFEQTLDGTDTIEIGTAYGGSAYLGARRAKGQGVRHWCIDEFGRPDSLMPGEPSMAITFSTLWAVDVHRWCALVPGTSPEVGWRFTDDQFGAAFIDGNHTAEWADLDMIFCDRVVRPGGYVATHDIWPEADWRHCPEYTAAVYERARAQGWSEAHRDGGTVVWQLEAT